MMTTHQPWEDNAIKKIQNKRRIDMSDGKDYDTPAIYRIRVKGVLDPSWSDWFDGFTIKSLEGETEMTGLVTDQAALHGILSRINDLGLAIVTNTQVGVTSNEQEG
jgi:hypothetical protein